MSPADPSPDELHHRARTILARLQRFEGGARFGLVPMTADVEAVAMAVMDLHAAIGRAAAAGDHRDDAEALGDLVAARALLLEAAALAGRLLDAVRPAPQRRRSG